MIHHANTARDPGEARIADAVKKSDGGSLAVLPFLSPRDRLRAKKQLAAAGYASRAYFFGGYPEAERQTLFLLPEYLLPCLSAPLDAVPHEELADLLGEDLTNAVCALRIRGSGFRPLSHRDYLGAILNLGLERDAIGDIAVQNEQEAVLFCSRTLALFLTEHLTKVASDSVCVSLTTPDATFTDGRHYAPIRDTVASPRLDCVVAALTNLSREGAQSIIRQGLVELDFEATGEISLLLTPPAMLSIRGYGRFALRSFDGETKKGRLRMFAEKFV